MSPSAARIAFNIDDNSVANDRAWSGQKLSQEFEATLRDSDLPLADTFSPNDGDVLTFDGAAGEWVPGAGGGGSLGELSDVDPSGVTDGQALIYDDASSTWIPGESGGDAPGSVIAQFSSTDTSTDINTSSYTAIPWNSTVKGDANLSVSGSEVTVSEDGLYRVYASVAYDANANARINPAVQFRVNGTVRSAQGLTGYVRSASGHDQGSNTLTEVLSLNANDTIEVVTSQMGAAGTVTMRSGESAFIVEKFGGTTYSIGTLDGYAAADFAKISGATFTGGVSFNSGLSVGSNDVFFQGGSLIAGDTDGAFADRSGSNIDHIWHDDSGNTWHMVSDGSYKQTGNTKLRVGSVSVGGTTLSIDGNSRIQIDTPSGNLRLGAGNSSFAHFYTDRPEFYMGTDLVVNGNIGIYNQNTYLQNDDLYLNGVIRHYGDTNTYIQFHGSDHFRVVTGGSERLEVNNSRTQIDNCTVTGTLIIPVV